MKREISKKLRVLALAAVMALISSVVTVPVNADEADTDNETGLTIEYMCGSLDDRYQSMRPYIKICNKGTETVAMSDLKVRYYYTKEGIAEETLMCFYTAIGATNINAQFYPELGYADIGFTAGAGNIAPGGNSGVMQLVLKKVTNGYYEQSNDYSYSPEITDYTEYDKMTLYYKDELVWGIEAPPPPEPPAPPPSGDDWLYVKGSKIFNKEGEQVYLTGINWFGFETDGANGFYGLNKCNIEDSLYLMAKRGFNLLRIPISAELILDWKKGDIVNTAFVSTLESPNLDGMNSLQILDYTIKILKGTGMKVMFDMHGASKDSYQDNLWYDKIVSMDQFVEAWEWLVTRYKDDDTVIAVDLKNEPHGKFSGPNIAKWDDSEDPNNWKHAAEVIGNAVLAINPNLLIVVEGVEAYPMDGYDYTNCGEFTTYCNWWGGNLRGVAKDPVKLSVPDKLIYSAHDYGPDIYVQPWFKKPFTKETLYEECWQPNWFYIMEQDIAPVLIGEWGGKLKNDNNKAWLTYLGEFLAENKVHHTFWSFNPNSADTGGLMLEDWKTVDEDKYEIVKGALFGKGLDHKVPLGGISGDAILAGDVDGNGNVNSIDLGYMKQFLLGMIKDFPAEKGMLAADVDDNDEVNSIDFGLMRQYFLGIIKEFPCQPYK